MDDELQINAPKPRWHPNREEGWYIVQEYDITEDEWRIIERTKSGRKAENLLLFDQNKNRRMNIEKEEFQCSEEQ